MNAQLRTSLLAILALLLLGLPAAAQRAVVLGGPGLNVTISDGDSTPRTTDGTHFGNVNVTGGTNSVPFRIRNDDSAAFGQDNNVYVTSITSSNSDFAMSSLPIVSPIAPNGGTANFTLTFNPSATGTRNATITINTLGEDPYTFAVRGVGLGFPEINVTGNGLTISDGDGSPRTADATDWGTVTAPVSLTHTFRVHNTGTANLTLSEFSDSVHWSVSGLVSSISPGGFDDFNVTYTPQWSGNHTGIIRIENNDSNEDPYTFEVHGFARAPEIQVLGGINLDDNITLGDPTPTLTERTDFGSIDINGGPITRTFRIRNTETSDGNAFTGNLIVSTITETSPHFSVPLQVYPPIFEGGFLDVTVQFDPISVGTWTTVLSIDNNDIDGGEDPYTFTIRGTGTGSPEIEVTGRPNPVLAFLPINDGDLTPEFGNGTNFGSLGVNAGSVSHQVRITNTGSSTLTVSATENSSAFSVSGLAASIAAGGSDIFNVTFNPASAGTFSTDIVLDTNDPDDGEDPYTFRVTGIGTAPEIEVRGGTGFSRLISDNDSTPSTLDFTNFGSRDLLASPLNRSFQIRNLGNENLVIGSVSVSNNPTFAVLPGIIPPIAPGANATFTIGFDPSTLGTHNATVTIQHNDTTGGESPYNFSITGQGIGSPEISVFGVVLGFGVPIADGSTSVDPANNTDFGTPDINGPSTTKVFRVSNTGSTNLTFGVTSSNPVFAINNVNSPVPPGGSDDFNITFSPSDVGTQSADITITNNDPDGNENPYTFRVSATTIGPEITVAGGQFLTIPIPDGDDTPRPEDHTDFGTVEIGQDSPVDHPFHVRNDATDDGNPATQNLVIDSITINGAGASQFSILSLPIILPLQEGNNGDLLIRYAPTAAGTHDALVVIQNNDPDEDPYSFAIRGVATSSAEIAVLAVGAISELPIPSGDTSPSVAKNTDFGRPNLPGPPTTKPFRVRNTGDATLTLSATVNGSRDFSVQGLATSIPAGGSDDFEITFDPASTGPRSATITIDTNDPDDNEDPYTFLVAGEGRAPEIAVFGGLRSDVEILDGDRTPNQADGTDFGEAENLQDFEEHTFMTRNLQDSDGFPLTGDLVISRITITGEGAPHFVLLPQLYPPIEEESFGTFTVRFAPTALGTHRATVTIIHNDPDDREAPFNFDIVGVSTGTPDIQVFGLPVPLLTDGTPIANGDDTPAPGDGTDFGTSDVYALLDRTHTFRVRNDGGVPLSVSVQENSPQFQITEPLAASIPAGGFDDFNITFDPQASGSHEALVTLTSDDPDENPYTFRISGQAYAPEIEVRGGNGFAVEIVNGDSTPASADGTDFGEVAVSSGAVERIFRITNTVDQSVPLGTGMLIIDQLVVSNVDNFSIVAGAFPAPILPGASHDFTVRFDPSDDDLQTAVVTIGHNDPDDSENPFTFLLQGTGLGDPEIAVFGKPIPFLTDGVPIANGADTPNPADGTDFGRALAGSLIDPATTFRIRNSGAGPLDVSVSIDSDQFEVSIPPLDTVPPNGFSDFTIVFNPDQVRNHTATVTIANNDSTDGENPYTFQITGEAWGPTIFVRGGADFDQIIPNGSTSPYPDAFTDMGGSLRPGSLERTFRIFNVIRLAGSPLSGRLSVFSITVSNPDVFSISAGAPFPPVPVIVPRDGFHDFNVRFTPNADGEFRGTVSILHDDPDQNAFTFEIVARAGDPDIHVSGQTPRGDFREIDHGDMDPSVFDGTEFQRVLVGDSTARTFRVLNFGGSELTATITSDSSEFVPSVTGEQSLAINTSLEFTILFNPTAPGQREATITIIGNDPDESPYTFKVAGEAIGPDIEVLGGPDLDVVIEAGDLSPDLADRTEFGNVQVGADRTHTFRISNPGNRTLAVSIEFSPGSDAEFTLASTTGSIPDGSFEDFTITFAPTSTGVRSAIVRIEHDGSEPDPYIFEVRGNGIPVLPTVDRFQPRFSFGPNIQGQRSASLNFQSEVGKTYRIVTTTDLQTWTPILTGLTGIGDLLTADLTPWLPSETNQIRLFRVEEE